MVMYPGRIKIETDRLAIVHGEAQSEVSSLYIHSMSAMSWTNLGTSSE
jgi:hypothetical protein